MRKVTLLVLVWCSGWYASGAAQAIDPSEDEKCFFNGGSTGTSGTQCSGFNDEWIDLTFNVTVACHNQCTEATWTSVSPSTSAYSGTCGLCPGRLTRDLYTQQTDQLLRFFSRFDIRGWHPSEGCEVTSTKKAEASCYCPGCGDPSPILISLSDGDWDLTDAKNGVFFDLDGDGNAERTAWTARNSDEGILALDRNLNGRIDNFMEVFGNHSPQLPSDEPNGWLALAVWDDSLNGGTEDGVIDAQDLVFGDLLIWVDKNHNGTSEPAELSTLEEVGIVSLGLDYDPDEGWVDDFGNGFRYPAPVQWSDGSKTVAWDVFFGGLR